MFFKILKYTKENWNLLDFNQKTIFFLKKPNLKFKNNNQIL